MKLKNIIQTGCLAMVIAASSASFAQSSISTYNLWNGTDGIVTSASGPATYRYGQSFTVGTDNILTDITVWTKKLNNATGGSTTAKIYQWNNISKQLIGSALYTSSAHTIGDTTEFTATTVQTSNLSLVTGTDYIFFFENDSQLLGSAWGAFDNGPANTEFVINVENLSYGWNNFFNWDLAFTANFTSSNPGNNAVPEPSEWAAMGLLGTGLLGLVVRGRKKKLAN